MGILRILKLKRGFSKISQMNRDDVERIQKENIENTLKHAIAESSFYKDFYDGAPTEKTPKKEFSSVTLVDKEKIMDNLDNVFTSSLLKRESLEQHLATSPVGKRYMDEFTVIHTSGSSGGGFQLFPLDILV